MVPIEWTQDLSPLPATADQGTAYQATAAAQATTFYSFLVRVPSSLIFIELMSHKKPTLVPTPR
jgi:hypothetical protein